MGRHGEESSKSFRNGDQGEGEGIQDPQGKEVGRQVGRKTQPEYGNTEHGEETGLERSRVRLSTRVWFAEARVLVLQESLQDESDCAPRHT